MFTIIIGSCGGLTGTFLAKHFRKVFPKVKIIGLDMSEYNYTKFIVDEFVLTPPSKEEEKYFQILKEIRKKVVGDIVYCPTHSQEMPFASKYQKDLNEDNIRIKIHDYDAVMLMSDKREAYRTLEKLGMPVPKLFEEETVTFPILAKPRVSSGSKGIAVIHTKSEFLEHRKRHDDEYIYVEFLKGIEYTVDCFYHKGNLIGFVPRKRLKTLGGAAIVTESDFSVQHLIEDYLRLLGKEFSLNGPANFQFFITNDSRIVFTDFNLRFASGGLPLAVFLGLDIPRLYIEASLKDHICGDVRIKKAKARMYRYFEEYFSMEDSEIGVIP